MSTKNSSRFTPLVIAISVVMGILIGTFYARHFAGNTLGIRKPVANNRHAVLRVVEDQYVCENVDVEGEHDYDSIVSAIIMERYDANKRDAIFANLEMARDMASELDEGKRAEYLKEYTDYQSYRIKAKEIAKEVLAKLK